MRKIGQRDADQAEQSDDQEQQEGPEGPWFDDEPLFIDEVEPVRCDIPGRPGEYICVQQVSDAVAKGRSRFYRSQSQAVKRGQPETTSTSVDATGLSEFIRTNSITDFHLKRRGGAELKFNPKSPGENLALYRKWTGKFGAWVDEQIQRVNGWGEEEDEKRERFPEPTAGVSAPAE